MKKRKTLLSDNMIFAKSCKKFKKTSVMKKQYTWRRQPWSSGAFGVRSYCPADVAQRSEFPQEYSLGGKMVLNRKENRLPLWVDLSLFLVWDLLEPAAEAKRRCCCYGGDSRCLG